VTCAKCSLANGGKNDPKTMPLSLTQNTPISLSICKQIEYKNSFFVRISQISKNGFSAESEGRGDNHGSSFCCHSWWYRLLLLSHQETQRFHFLSSTFFFF